MAFAKMRGCITEGLSDEEICERFGLPWEAIDEIRRKFMDEEAEYIRHRSTEHTYVQYCLEMRRCIEDLEKVGIDYVRGPESTEESIAAAAKVNVSGFVGAVRARADILDRIIKTGQDFGLIERKVDGKGFAAGEAIKDMNNAEFRRYIFQEINVFNTLQVKYGDRNFEDIDPGPLYQSISTPKFPIQKTTPHARGKVYGGRKAVKKRSGNGVG